MSNILMIPIVAFSAYGTKLYMNSNVFTTFNRVKKVGSYLIKDEDEIIQNIAKTIIKGALIGFNVGAVLASGPAVLFTENPKSCVVLGALACSVLGAVKAAVFLDKVVEFNEPFKGVIKELKEFV